MYKSEKIIFYTTIEIRENYTLTTIQIRENLLNNSMLNNVSN